MNKKTPSIKINFIYTLSYQILALIVPLITTPYVSRIFSPDSIGMISYTTSYSNYFLLIGNLGIATYAQIEIARNREDRAQTSRLFFEILIARTTTMLLSLLLYIGFTAAAAPQYRPLYWILIANIVGSMLDCSWFFQGLEQFKRVTLRNFIIKILSTIMIFVFIKKPSDLYLYVLFLYGSTIAANLYLWLGISKEVGRVDFRQLKFTRHYKGCFLYFLPTIASTLNTSMGKTLLGILGRSDAENGYFEQAYKIFNVIIVLPASLNVVMRPRMAYLVSNQKKDEVESKLYYSMSFIMFLMIAIGFGLIGTADNLVPWFFGPGWDKVSFLLKLFSLCIVLYSITLCFSEQYFLPYGKIKTLTKIIYAGLAVNILINILLIKKFFSVGTTIATIVAELVMMILSLYLAKKDIDIWAILKLSLKYVFAGAVMLAVLLLINPYTPVSPFGFLLLMGAGFVSYAAVLIILRDAFLLDAVGQMKKFVKKVFGKINR